MKNKSCFFVAVCAALLINFSVSVAQNKTISIPPPIEGKNEAKNDLIDEVILLRQTVQDLSKQIKAMLPKLESDAGNKSLTASQNRILLNLEIMSRAEARAELLRKQLVDLSEKEITIKARLKQLEEDSRPDNVDRNLNVYGTTRTVELRENRKKMLEIETNGLRTLVAQVEQSVNRLQSDVVQADELVETLRRRVFPALKRELEKPLPTFD